jgi:hypothetical protein
MLRLLHRPIGGSWRAGDGRGLLRRTLGGSYSRACFELILQTGLLFEDLLGSSSR